MRKLVAVFAAGALLFAGCSTETSQPPATNFTSLTDFYAQTINWEKCGRYQCAELLVPLDYDNLAAGVFNLALTKVAARKSAERIGNIVVNPGGPGGSGIEFAQGGTRTASATILDKFDLIGFDPRGVGKSDPVKCFTDAETDEFLAADETPDTQAEVEVWNNWVDRFALACKEQNPDTWMHIGSWNVARDMDILRAALGDEKLNWLGKSYGTLLGALYAELFPDQVGRFVLDGPVDPDNDSDQSLVQIKAFEVALKRFIADCLTRRSCPLTGDPETAYQQLLDFIDALDQEPIQLSDNRLLTQSHAQTAILVGLYDDKDLWPFLRDALEFAFTGDGEYLMLLADLINNRDSDGKYLDNSLAALYAVNCVDFAKALTPNELPAEVERLSKESRFFGPLFGWGSSACLGWMNEELEVVAKLSANPNSPVLIVGTEFDPATPIQWAKSLAAQINNSVVVSWVGDGHTAYRRGSNCVDQLIDNYFINGALPTTGTICPAIRRN
jgi:pimeloyl-ACP methyl ester carboxylesterase